MTKFLWKLWIKKRKSRGAAIFSVDNLVDYVNNFLLEWIKKREKKIFYYTVYKWQDS